MPLIIRFSLTKLQKVDSSRFNFIEKTINKKVKNISILVDKVVNDIKATSFLLVKYKRWKTN